MRAAMKPHVGMSVPLAQHIRDSWVMSYCKGKERGGIKIVGKEKYIYLFFSGFLTDSCVGSS